MNALETVKQYYNYFNQQDREGMLSLVHPDKRHEPNQGEARLGKEKFSEFIKQMDEAYEEQLSDMTFFTEASGSKVAAEFVVNGLYKKADKGFPPAHNQPYKLPAAAFLEVKDGKIIRVTTYYNLQEWIQLVSE